MSRSQRLVFTLASAAWAALVCAATSGCASAWAPSWAKSADQRAIEAAADDNSFPSAAEAGLASTK